jgi:hypothetical protein
LPEITQFRMMALPLNDAIAPPPLRHGRSQW